MFCSDVTNFEHYLFRWVRDVIMAMWFQLYPTTVLYCISEETAMIGPFPCWNSRLSVKRADVIKQPNLACVKGP